jgi:Zn-dependent alcohol dehydrogenase
VVGEIDIPDPGPNQVTVRNFASGVCYSQVHQLRNPGMPRPMGLGHEGSGVVTHVGKEVTHVKAGVIADGDVYTWSEHMVTFAEKVVPMSPSDPIDITCLVGCAVLTGAGAVLHTAKVGLGQSVAVFGVGGVWSVGDWRRCYCWR